jgi:ParB-like chromosome segregation protein Spo0J
MTEFTAKSVKISDIKIIDTKNKMMDIDSLADSIKKYGLLYPILVDENYNLMDGMRRIEAYEKLGIEHIPTYIRSVRKG